MTWEWSGAAGGASLLVTLLIALCFVRLGETIPLLRDRSDGRPIGGPGLAAGVLVGLGIGGADPFLLGGAGGIIILGALDDRLDLSPTIKLIGQGIAAAVALFGLNGIGTLSLAGGSIPLGPVGPVLTLLWVVGLTNAVNLIDGLDGLAVGVSIPPTLALLIIGAGTGNAGGIALGAVLLGGLLGFYPWNRFRARLLLGDTGAELIGYLLAVTSIRVLPADVDAFPLISAVFLFSFPLADTAFAIVRRAYHHRALFHGDRDHIHHRLKRTIGEGNAVLALSLFSLISAGIGLLLWSIGM